MKDKRSTRGQVLKETGCRETDGDKEMQNERWMPWGDQAQRLKGWRAAELTDRDKREEEHEGEEETSVR